MVIRLATAQDLDALAGIEESADSRFEAWFGPAPFGSSAGTDGHRRAARSRFILVATVGPGLVGFAQVLDVEGGAHLEQLSVRAEAGRQGAGRALVYAATDRALANGSHSMTLRTYADVPWNGPFYETCGFREIPDADSAWHREMLRHEDELGLAKHGRRVLMARELRAVPQARRKPSSAEN